MPFLFRVRGKFSRGIHSHREKPLDGWTFEGQPGTLGDTTVTLVENGSFCVCAGNGDIVQGGAQGIFHADTRLVSRWELRVDEAPVEPLTVIAGEPYHATFVGRAAPRPGRVESTLLVIRDRYVGAGLREDLTLRNLSDEPAGCVLDMYVGSDMADLFEVKSGRVHYVADVEVTPDRSGFMIFSALRSRGTRVLADPAPFAVPGMLIFRIVVPARADWTVTLQVNPILEGRRRQAGSPPAIRWSTPSPSGAAPTGGGTARPSAPPTVRWPRSCTAPGRTSGRCGCSIPTSPTNRPASPRGRRGS